MSLCPLPVPLPPIIFLHYLHIKNTSFALDLHSVLAAFNVFVKTVIKEEQIPFELSAKDRDDFYSEANIRHLEELKRLDDAGQLHFVTKTWEELKAMET